MEMQLLKWFISTKSWLDAFLETFSGIWEVAKELFRNGAMSASSVVSPEPHKIAGFVYTSPSPHPFRSHSKILISILHDNLDLTDL